MDGVIRVVRSVFCPRGIPQKSVSERGKWPQRGYQHNPVSVRGANICRRRNSNAVTKDGTTLTIASGGVRCKGIIVQTRPSCVPQGIRETPSMG